ncbi:MAG TPA: 2,3-butanediol dehydrogenase [Propionibacterium sp.]|nr:2,3-butanediol dehydrogenase [Propionibacterium sp.]
MKALQFHGKEDVRVEDVAEPSPQPGEVKLRNAYSGICGSDLHIYFAPEASGMDFSEPHPLTGATLPQILGHEFAGTVAEVGEGVTNVEVGDEVAVWGIYSCGECGACEKGLPNACEKISFHGVYSDGGGMAEYTTVTADRLHKLPDNVDLKMGALVEPMAVAWHAVNVSGAEAGATALVVGAGPIGFGAYFALKAKGIDKVIVSEPSPERRAALVAVGADHVVDPINGDLAGAVREMTGGRGVDFAYDASGNGPAFLQGIDLLGARGLMTVIALHEKAVEFNPTMLVMREKRICATLGYLQEVYDEVIAAMAEGKYDFTGWVETTNLEGVADAMQRLRAGRAMKILVEAV